MYSVYRITNLKNKRIYIGSTVNPEVRKSEHFSRLRQKKHCNRFLQLDFDTYSEEAFIFEVIFDDFKSRQQMLIKEYELILKTKGRNYNIDTDCPVLIPHRNNPKPKKVKLKRYAPIKESPKYRKGQAFASKKRKFVNIYPNLTAIAERKKLRDSRHA